MVSKHSAVNVGASSKTDRETNQENNWQASQSFGKMENKKYFTSENSRQSKPLSNSTDERQFSSRSQDCRPSPHSRKEACSDPPFTSDSHSGWPVKEAVKSSPVKNSSQSHYDRLCSSDKSDNHSGWSVKEAVKSSPLRNSPQSLYDKSSNKSDILPADRGSEQKTHHSSSDCRLEGRSQKSFMTIGSAKKTDKGSTRERDTSRSPSLKPAVSCSDRNNREGKSVSGVSSSKDDIVEKSDKHSSKQTVSKRLSPSHFKKNPLGVPANPCSPSSQGRQSGNNSPSISQHHCSLPPTHRHRSDHGSSSQKSRHEQSRTFTESDSKVCTNTQLTVVHSEKADSPSSKKPVSGETRHCSSSENHRGNSFDSTPSCKPKYGPEGESNGTNAPRNSEGWTDRAADSGPSDQSEKSSGYRRSSESVEPSQDNDSGQNKLGTQLSAFDDSLSALYDSSSSESHSSPSPARGSPRGRLESRSSHSSKEPLDIKNEESCSSPPHTNGQVGGNRDWNTDALNTDNHAAEGAEAENQTEKHINRPDSHSSVKSDDRSRPDSSGKSDRKNSHSSGESDHKYSHSSVKSDHKDSHSSVKSDHKDSHSSVKRDHKDSHSSGKRDHRDSHSSGKSDHKDSNSSVKSDHKDSNSSVKSDHKDSHSSGKSDHRDSHSSVKSDHKDSNSSGKSDHKDSHSSVKSDHKDSNNSVKSHHKDSHSWVKSDHRDSHSWVKSDVKSEHRSRSQSHSSVKGDRHHSKSKHSSPSQSHKHSSTSSEKHTSEDGATNPQKKPITSDDRRTREDSILSGKHDQALSTSPHCRHSDAQVSILKSADQTSRPVSDGNKRKKSVCIQLEDDSSSRRSSLKSPISEEDGLHREAGTTPPRHVTSPDTVSEKCAPTSGQKQDEKDSVSDAGSSEKPSLSKPDDTKSTKHSTNHLHSSSPSHKSRRISTSRKHPIEIKPVTYIVDRSCGYVTSPDISSEEEEEETKSAKEQSASSRPQRRGSTNSQTGEGDEVGPASLSKHQLKPSLDRLGGSYEERLKVMEKLQAVRQKMDETAGYNRKRAARGEVRKRRARREKLEGDFSGPCRDKIEYNVEEKPSLKRPEPKPEEPKPEKPPPPKPKPEKPKKEKKERPKKEKKERPPKEKKEKAKRERKDPKEMGRSRDRTTSPSKPPSKDYCHSDAKIRTSKPERKQKIHSTSLPSDSQDSPNAKHSRKRNHGDSSPLGSDQNSNPSAPDHNALQEQFMKMRSVWASVFSKPKASEAEDTPADVAPASAAQTSESEKEDPPSAPKKKKKGEEEEERCREKTTDLDIYLSDA